MKTAPPPVPALPATQHAIQFVGAGQLVHNRAKPVPAPRPDAARGQGRGGRDLLLRHEAPQRVRDPPPQGRGLGRPRRGGAGGDPELRAGRAADRPRPRGRRADRGRRRRPSRATRSASGCLVQTDYRHLPTPGSNAAFGYNFEGGLQEYVLLDERMIIEPGTGERFLIPVDEAPSGSAIALLEPWACVEASYASPRALHAGARAAACSSWRTPGTRSRGWRPLARRRAARHGDGGRGGRRPARRPSRRPWTSPGPAIAFAADADGLPGQSFDDIVYFGADADRIEQLQGLLATRGRHRRRARRRPDRAARRGRRRPDPLRPDALGRHDRAPRRPTATRSRRPTASFGRATGSP